MLTLPEVALHAIALRIPLAFASWRHLPAAEQEANVRGLQLWRDAVIAGWAAGAPNGSPHPTVTVALELPRAVRQQRRTGGRTARAEHRELLAVVRLARGPAAGLLLPMEDGERWAVLCRARVRNLIDAHGQRVDTAATHRELRAQLNAARDVDQAFADLVPDHVPDDWPAP